MWSYYGSKSKVVNKYPKPKFDKIIEPFAGSARYSLKYFDHDILLVDKYDVVVRIWKYLQACSKKDIIRLPLLKRGQSINRADFDCIEQAWLMGFLITNGVSTPMLTTSKWGEVVMEKQRNDIANNLYKIRHWNIIQADYKEISNQKATWFIDPPYINGGHKYKYSNKKINYHELSGWCKNRQGQIIVCENTSAGWLPFSPLVNMNGIRKTTTEAFFTNYDFWQQGKLI